MRRGFVGAIHGINHKVRKPVSPVFARSVDSLQCGRVNSLKKRLERFKIREYVVAGIAVNRIVDFRVFLFECFVFLGFF